MANFFGISIDVLLTKELTVNELYNFDIFKIDMEKPAGTAESIRQSTEQVLFVPITLQTEYTIKYGDNSFLEKLPVVSLPNFSRKNCRAFEMQGNEMQLDNHGLFHGDILFCKKANPGKQEQLKEGTVYVAIAELSLIHI